MVGLDADPAAVAACRGRGLEAVCGGPEDLGGLGPFSLVVMMDVLEHVADDLAALRAAAEALVPGGRLVVSAPAHPWLFSYHDRASGHFRRYSRPGLVGLLRAAGFEVGFIGWQCLAGLVAAVPFRAVRSLAGSRGADDAAAGRFAGSLDRVLSRWALVEARLAAGGRLPAGLTLWAAAGRPVQGEA